MIARDDPARSRNLRLTDAEWSALERIARRLGLEWGGIPNRTEAVKWMLRHFEEHPEELDRRG